MSGHTPGPWCVELDRTNDGDIEIVMDGGQPGLERSIALLDCRDQPDDMLSPWRDEALANARLIAAAPDLYDALLDLVEQLKKGRFLNDHGDAMGLFAMEAVHAAIAKAVRP